MTTKVSAKSTKAEILEALAQANAKLKEKQATTLNPTQVKKARRKKEVVEKTTSLDTDAIEKSIQTVRNRAFSLLNELEKSFKEEVANLRTVEEGIEFRNEELKEVFGIEDAAGSLAALVEAQNQRKAEFDENMAKQRADFQEEMAKARKTWQEDQDEHERQFNLKTQLDQERRDRELEEHKYNFGRTERERIDQLNDQLRQQKRAYALEVETREKDLANRAEEIAKQEQAHADALAKVTQLEADIVTKVAEATESTKKSMATSNNIAQGAMKKDYEAQITVLEGKLESATQRADHASARIENLEQDLASARAEVQQVALRALDAQGSKAAMEAVQTAVANTGKGK